MNSSESTVPVYSGDRLELCAGEVDINLQHDPQFHHLSQVFERALREGSTSVKPTDRHKTNVLPLSSSFCSLVLSCLLRSVIASRRRLRLFTRWSYFRYPSGFIGAHFARLSRPRETHRGSYSQYPLQLDGQSDQDRSGRGFHYGTQEVEAGAS